MKKIRLASLLMVTLVYSRLLCADVLPYEGVELGLNIEEWNLKDTAFVSTDFGAKGGIGGKHSG